MNARVAGWPGSDAARAGDGAGTADGLPRFLTVRDLADYLHINEKKVYALASDGLIPATKVTGKWLFPRDLIDQWLLESTHGGVFTDRLILTGGCDPLLQHALNAVAGEVGNRALLSYCPTETRLGLELLARGRVDVCLLHWGPASESRHRHAALLHRFGPHRPWLLLRLCHREQGMMLSQAAARRCSTLGEAFDAGLCLVMRREGSGSQRFFLEALARHERDPAELVQCGYAHTGREAASMVAMGMADAAPGSRGLASEFGLAFIPAGWEALDLAMPKEIYFRQLFQSLLERLRSDACRERALHLGGYDLKELGSLVEND